MDAILADDVVVLDETLVVDTGRELTARSNVPELPLFFWSPLYDAVMVTVDVSVEEGVYETLHCLVNMLVARVQVEVGENDPDPLLLHVTSPVGESPPTTTVHRAAESLAT